MEARFIILHEMIRVVVPELVEKARGVRSMDAIVAASHKAFSKTMYRNYENGHQPRDRNKLALAQALGVSYEKITLPLDKVPKDSKFFLHPVNLKLTKI